MELCIGQIEASTSPPPPPGHLTPLPSWGGGNLITRVFQGVGNLIPMCQGWGIWTAPLISCESLAWWAMMGDAVLEDFHGKDCAFVANWFTRKGLNQALCHIWRYLNFNIFNIGFRLWIQYMNVLSCVYNEIQYLLPAIQYNNKTLNRGQLLWPAASQ